MQTLYNHRITDRVRVDESFGQFIAFFDDERIGAFSSGHKAVQGAIAFLQERARLREEEAAAKRAQEAVAQQNADDAFLYDLSDRLGISVDDLERLIEIINRRNE